MEAGCLIAFEDELQKIAASASLPGERTQRKVDYFFSPKAGRDKWDKLVSSVRSQKFVDALSNHPLADDTLKLHVQSLHDLSRGRPVAKIQSETLPGKTYEVREMSNGNLGCQCGDWRYKGSVNPGYECKHIRAFRQGLRRAA